MAHSILSILVLLATLFIAPFARAGRPVYQDLTRDQLIEHSDFVFSGWPSTQPAQFKCGHELGRWQVHKVYRGDKSLEDKVISLADHSYKVYADAQAKGEKPPSHAAFRFRNGKLEREQSSSILFTNHRDDGCFELAALGAQEHRFAEAEIDALFASPPDCDLAKRGFTMQVETLPHDCKQDSECDSFFLHPDTCAPPYFLNKSARAQLEREEFKSLQRLVEKACLIKKDPAVSCEALVRPARCRVGRCEEGRATQALIPPKFEKATLTDSCAPHDALSSLIAVREAKSEYPLLTVNFWSGPRPSRQGGTFVVETKGSDNYADGVQASYCPYKAGCKAVKKLRLKLVLQPGTMSGELEYSFVSADDENISGHVPVQFTAGNQICG